MKPNCFELGIRDDLMMLNGRINDKHMWLAEESRSRLVLKFVPHGYSIELAGSASLDTESAESAERHGTNGLTSPRIAVRAFTPCSPSYHSAG